MTTSTKSQLRVDESPVLLRAEGLKKRFGGQIVLDGVDLELRQGEVVLLRGENGSGKTTLLNILTGNLEPDAGIIRYQADDTPRSYRFPRRWWHDLNPFDHFTPEFVSREGVCRTWQDVRLFESQSLRDNIAVAHPENVGENPMTALFRPSRSSKRDLQIADEASSILSRLGLSGREESSADKISLGQSKRVAIARAVASGARVLLLDEPLAGLDLDGVADVLALLESLVSEHEITIIVVEHTYTQRRLRDLVTTHWLLQDGKIRRSNVAKNEIEVRAPQATAGTERTMNRPEWLSMLSSDEDSISEEALDNGGVLMRVRSQVEFREEAKPILEISNIMIRRGSRVVIGSDGIEPSQGLSFSLHENELGILFAPNGWGKSSLLAAICGLIPLESGSIRLDGIDLNGLDPAKRFRYGLRALPSDNQIFPNLKVRDLMKLSRSGTTPAAVAGLSNRLCSSLSGGERKKVAIAAMSKGRIGVYDEPFYALDEFNASEFPKRNSADNVSAQLILVPST